jgi:DNA repair protein RadC
MNTNDLSTIELLRHIVGARKAQRLYRGLLGPIFDPKEGATPDHVPFLAARELMRRWLQEEIRHRPTLGSPIDAQDYLKVHLAGKEREIFSCLFLDTRHALIACEDLFTGTIDGATVYPREVVKRALQLNSAAIIIAHNHPSGIAEPSEADRGITLKLSKALSLVEIRLLDHLVVAGGRVVSMAERGLV